MKKRIVDILIVLTIAQFSSLGRAGSCIGEASEFDPCRTQVALDLRLRSEVFSQNNYEQDALASLLKTRANIDHQLAKGVNIQIELDNVSAIGAQRYNSTRNSMIGYPTIADSEGSDLNQLWIGFTDSDLEFRLGRQRILIADKRFIGSKPWRNNEQTYDGLRIKWSPTDDLNFDGSYVVNVNRVYGPVDGENPADWDGDNLFFEAQYLVTQKVTAKSFFYDLDIEPQPGFAASKTVNNSSRTLGFSIEGEFSPFTFRSSVALQGASGPSELDYKADYYSFGLDATIAHSLLSLGIEQLGSDNNIGFSTPLANGHGYQGWADQFLRTPSAGVRDVWVGIDSTIDKVELKGAFHDFHAAIPNSEQHDFGRELDLLATWHVDKNLAVTAKAAIFDATESGIFVNATKFWFMVEYSI